MEWINIHVAKQLRGPACVGSSPAELGTWLLCLGYCCEQENSGRMVGAALWKDRQLQRAVGVTMAEVRRADRLLRIEGDDIIVNGYPEGKQANVQRLRGQSLVAAERRWGKRDGIDGSMPQGMPYGNPSGMPKGNAEGEGEGEDKGEEKGKGMTQAAPADDSFLEFWDRYGVKKSKPAAARAWKRLSKADKDAALAGIDAYKGTVRDSQFLQHPSTYLNQRTWENEIPNRPLTQADCPYPVGSNAAINWIGLHCGETVT
jgi:hypothetical protein